MNTQRKIKGLLLGVTGLSLSAIVVISGLPVLAQGTAQTPTPTADEHSAHHATAAANATGTPTANLGMGGIGGMDMSGMMGGQFSPQQLAQMNSMMNMMGGTGNIGGMMDSGMMGGGMINTGGSFGPGSGMMGAWTPSANLLPTSGKTLAFDQATAIAKAYVAAWNSKTTLELGDIMQFNNHFYGEAVEFTTKRGAFEFLIDPTSGTVYAEPGPNMMWNLRYGTMGSMMGLSQGTNDGDKMVLTPDQAIKAAQDYLDKALPGTKAETKSLAFYGFYTLDTLRDGKVIGMLSINGYTGQVWLHQWHGDFVTATAQ